MKQLINILLIIHVSAGALALIVAPLALIVKKGGAAHRLWGKIFFYTMTIVIITALIVAIYKFIPFLLMIAVLSYYSIVSGYRVLFNKAMYRGVGVKPIDWVAALISAIANAIFIIWGVSVMSRSIGMAVMAVLFGCLGLFLSGSDIVTFIRKPSDRMHWLYAHIRGFMAGYIATLTAFSATVLHALPGIWAWVWPTLIGTPLIVIWIRYYKKQFRKGARASELLVLKK